jgi:hypothetical protein
MPLVSIQPPPERVIFESDADIQEELMQNEVSMAPTLTARRLSRRYSVDMLSEAAAASVKSVRSHLTPSRKGAAEAKTSPAPLVQPDSRSIRTGRDWMPPLQKYQLIKHGRWGRPKLKLLDVDRSLGTISWGTGTIHVEDIVQVRKGRQTKVLQRKYARGEDEGRFMSLVLARRTIDWELQSRTERNRLVIVFQNEVETYMERERGKKLHWARRNTQTDIESVSNLRISKKRGFKRLLSCFVRP